MAADDQNCASAMTSRRSGGGRAQTTAVMDGSDIIALVRNEQVFSNFVDRKFHELDGDGDGKLSVKELQPAVADIGAALGLPPQGSSAHSDHIYSQVLSEFTHGTAEKVSKAEFRKVLSNLSDILLGMAAGLKRDPVLILRVDGQDLRHFINSSAFEPEMVSILSEIEPLPGGTLKHTIVQAFQKLSLHHRMPPASDSWVMSNVIEPALRSCDGDYDWQDISQDSFLPAFMKAAEMAAQSLNERPVMVAHSEKTFNGDGIKRLLSNKIELDKTLQIALESVPKDRHRKMSKEYLRVALDAVAPAAGLPPLGAVDQMDKIMAEALKVLDADDGKAVKEGEFGKILTEILGTIMLQLEGNPISVSTDSVVHQPLPSASSLLRTTQSEP